MAAIIRPHCYTTTSSVVQYRRWWRKWRGLLRLQRRLVYLLALALLTVLFVTLLMYANVSGQLERPRAGWSLQSSVVFNKLLRPNTNGSSAVNRSHNTVVAPVADAPSAGSEISLTANASAAAAPVRVRFTGPTNRQQAAVRAAFLHAWRAYRRHAWGYDQLRPLSRTGHNWLGLGVTLVDSLDTLLLMNLRAEYAAARRWVAESLHFTGDRYVNVFETTIRVLGGLLSAHHLSGDPVLLARAVQLGERLLPAFATRSGVPYSDISLGTGRARGPLWMSGSSSTAEVATLQLEFNHLSYVTGRPIFSQRAMAVSRRLHQLVAAGESAAAGGGGRNGVVDGLVSIFIQTSDGRLSARAPITLGARGDSYYEYLVKVYAQLGAPAAFMRDDFELAMRGVYSRLLGHSSPSRLAFIGELASAWRSSGGPLLPKMDHLVCFLPAALVLAARLGLDASGRHMRVAEQLLFTCYQTYARHATHLAAEITHFKVTPASAGAAGASVGAAAPTDDFYVKPADTHCLLRPETVESLWYMYHVTGNVTYRQWGWDIFEAIERHAKVPSGGYASLNNVLNAGRVGQRDSMESFFLAETLKYLYLLFSDDQKTLNLEDYVFNTEAHPLPVLKNHSLLALGLL